MSVRTYNPAVRVGNWNEDLCLEEHALKDFLEKRENGELLTTETGRKAVFMMEEVQLSKDSTGYGHIKFGDNINIYNPAVQSSVCWYFDGQKTQVTASKHLHPCKRNTFTIKSVDGNKQDGDYLTYEEKFFLYTDHLGKCIANENGGDNEQQCEPYQLASEKTTFAKPPAPKSGKQAVYFEPKNDSYGAYWQILCFDPKMRMESQGLPVPANTKILFNHCKTNERLRAIEDKQLLTRTLFGFEHEVAAHTNLDSHKAEKSDNHFMLIIEPPQPTAEQN